MVWRCRDKRNPYYGGAGVTVDPRWESFGNFLADMGERPPGTTLDRIDNTAGYAPGNCRWADRSTQNNNRPGINRMVTLEGRTQTLTQWAAEVGLSEAVVFNRVRLGWSEEKTLTTAVDSTQSSSAGKGWADRRARHPGPRLITVDGQTRSISEWAREIGVRPTVINARIKAGWPEAVAATTRALRQRPGAGWDLPQEVIASRASRKKSV